MTFTEAAIEVLRREGKPLHFRKIAEIAVRESLLDHVGKVPEETMADQLAAHCRLPRAEWHVAPVQAGTFALVEWGLEEDPTGLDALVEAPPEQEPLYRSRERHPVPSRDLARTAARGEGGRGEGGARGRRRDEDERRGRRFPPPAEVAYEILAGAGRPLGVAEIAALGAERVLMPEAFVRETASLESALLEDNRRREGAGRRPLFQIESGTVTLVAQPEPGERVVAAPVAARVPASLPDVRRTALASLRRRLRECDAPTVEHVAGKLLEKLGFRDLKVAKRGREHVIYTARKRMGVADVRHGIRILRGGAEAGRRDVSDLRRDLGHYGAQLGIVISAGDAARDARSEAIAAGQLPVVLLCGEALAEAFSEAGVGCVPVVVPEVDEGFFKAAAESAEREEAARRARREERDERERRDRREPGRREERARASEEGRPGAEGAAPEIATTATGERGRAEIAPAIVEVPAYRVVLGSDDGDDEGPDDGSDEGAEGDEDEGPGEEGPGVEASASGEESATAEGAAGERRRRRRRRRRRGGRGRGREGAAPAEGVATPEGAAAAPPPGAAPEAQSDAPPQRQDEGTRPAEPVGSSSPPAAPDGGDGGAA